MLAIISDTQIVQFENSSQTHRRRITSKHVQTNTWRHTCTDDIHVLILDQFITYSIRPKGAIGERDVGFQMDVRSNRIGDAVGCSDIFNPARILLAIPTSQPASQAIAAYYRPSGQTIFVYYCHWKPLSPQCFTLMSIFICVMWEYWAEACSRAACRGVVAPRQTLSNIFTVI